MGGNRILKPDGTPKIYKLDADGNRIKKVKTVTNIDEKTVPTPKSKPKSKADDETVKKVKKEKVELNADGKPIMYILDADGNRILTPDGKPRIYKLDADGNRILKVKTVTNIDEKTPPTPES